MLTSDAICFLLPIAIMNISTNILQKIKIINPTVMTAISTNNAIKSTNSMIGQKHPQTILRAIPLSTTIDIDSINTSPAFQ
ncbi:MAG: hypothetical protein UT53_C0021G0006 [Candidatus Yanofskybacteria bacterium GW2011_GWD2_39_48]|uniref:Uncharacterized protein n=1 Tax=Candidatus Yanofskybacteria bacterium GW2011_GWD2_39_48 TaxID=1619031 RepID=A0A0G0P548_9BACT|nr:MAG: hypothetical protein UT53_C0021G0006 [Candidatus Yanofskybacteria bacterium GW2011_GWD2_39_48]